MSSGQLFQCPDCDHDFTLNKNLVRHVNIVHGNEARKDNEARKEGSPKVPFWGPVVEYGHQVSFKSPKEYVAMPMKVHHDKQLASEEFMLATGLSVFQHINDTFWSLMYERPDLYVYVTDDMVSWLGFGGASKHQKNHLIRTLDALSISYKYLNIEELKKASDQVLKIPIDSYD